MGGAVELPVKLMCFRRHTEFGKIVLNKKTTAVKMPQYDEVAVIYERFYESFKEKRAREKIDRKWRDTLG